MFLHQTKRCKINSCRNGVELFYIDHIYNEVTILTNKIDIFASDFNFNTRIFTLTRDKN